MERQSGVKFDGVFLSGGCTDVGLGVTSCPEPLQPVVINPDVIVLVDAASPMPMPAFGPPAPPVTTEQVTEDQLLERLFQCPDRFSRWRHKKSGNVYLVLRDAINENDLQPMVLYRRVKPASDIPFVRPLTQFLEKFEALPNE